MSSNFNKLYIDGFLTQWAFHRVQEHPKWSSLLSSILILIFIPYMHLFIHVFIYSYHLRIHVMSLSIHVSPVFLSCILLFIYIFTIHYSRGNPAKSRDFGTHA